MNEKDFIRLSPSQVKTAKDCLRKWGLTYLDGIRQPHTAATKAGEEMHTVAEEWLSKSVVPDENTKAGRLFLSGINFLPLPAKHLLVEQGFEFWEGPLLWRGFIDLINPESRPIRITDHKTTSNLRWALSCEELREDIQATIYAKHVLERFGIEEVECQWVYYQKGNRPKAKEAIVNIAKSEIKDSYLPLGVLGRDLLKLKQTHDTGLEIEVDEFPHEGCGKFGGCYFFDVCRSKEEGRENVSTLLERLKKNGKKKKDPALPAINPPIAFSDSVVVSNEGGTSVGIVSRPSEPPVYRAVGDEPTEVEIFEAELISPDKPTEVVQVVAIEEEKPKRRGRPKGSKNKPKKEEPKTEEPKTKDTLTEQAPVEEPPKVVLEAPANESSILEKTEGFNLFVDCAPVEGFGDTRSGNRYIREAATRAAEENGVLHYRFIEYGGGPGAISVALEEVLNREIESGRLNGKSVVVDTSDQAAKDCLSVFSGKALGTVRGLR